MLVATHPSWTDPRRGPERARGPVTTVSGEQISCPHVPRRPPSPERSLIAATSIGGRLRIQPPGGAAHQRRSGRRQHGPLRVRQPGQAGHADDHRQLHPARGARRRPELLSVRRRRPLRDPHRQQRRRPDRRHATLPVQDHGQGRRTSPASRRSCTTTARSRRLTDANWLVPQTYNGATATATAIARQPSSTPPANIGPRSTPELRAASAATAVKSLDERHQGLRRASATMRSSSTSARSSTSAGLRPFNALHAHPAHGLSAGVDGVGGFNTNTIAIQVPIALLTKDRELPTGANDPDAVLGIWASRQPAEAPEAQSDGTVDATPARGSRSPAWAIRSSTR